MAFRWLHAIAQESQRNEQERLGALRILDNTDAVVGPTPALRAECVYDAFPPLPQECHCCGTVWHRECLSVQGGARKIRAQRHLCALRPEQTCYKVSEFSSNSRSY